MTWIQKLVNLSSCSYFTDIFHFVSYSLRPPGHMGLHWSTRCKYSHLLMSRIHCYTFICHLLYLQSVLQTTLRSITTTDLLPHMCDLIHTPFQIDREAQLLYEWNCKVMHRPRNRLSGTRKERSGFSHRTDCCYFGSFRSEYDHYSVCRL